MWRFLTIVSAAVVVSAVCLGSLVVARQSQDDLIAARLATRRAVHEAQGYRAQVAELAQARAATRTEATSSDAAVLEDASQTPKETSPKQLNRFDRGRLGETFDGEQLRSSSELANSPEFPPLPTDAPPRKSLDDSGSLDSGSLDPLLRKNDPGLATNSAHDSRAVTQLFPGGAPDPFAPTPSPSKLRPSISDDESAVAPPSRSLPPVAAAPKPQYSRVTLVRTADHQIHIIAERKVAGHDQTLLPVGAMSITAEEYTLTPATEPGSGNLLHCTGRIEIRGQHFTARCSKLSVKNSDLVLEGLPGQPAEIVKLEPLVENADATHSDGSEFRLSAKQISFSLTLDKIKVSDSVSIEPTVSAPAATEVPAAAPAVPPPAGAAIPAANPPVPVPTT